MISFHAKPLNESPYNALLQQFLHTMNSPYTSHNLHCINTMQHSILCRDIFNNLLAGCTSLQRAQGRSIDGLFEVCDNALTFFFDGVLRIRIELLNADDVLVDEEAFKNFIASQ